MIIKKIAAVGLGLCAVFGLHSHVYARASAISSSESQAYQLAYQLEVPAARSEVFIHSVEDLQRLTDEVAIEQSVKDLDSNAAELRSTEASAYNRALILATSMGAPASLRTWLQQSVTMLEAPVVIADDVKDIQKDQPATARIISTLDECTALHTQSVDNQSSVMLWLKISSGKDALWANDVGALSARMYVSLSQADGLHHPTPSAALLAKSAPKNTPLEVLRALRAIAPPIDKIAPTDSLVLNPDVVQAAYSVLTAQFAGDSAPPTAPAGTTPKK